MRRTLLAILSIAIALATPVCAETPEEKGLALAHAAHERSGGYGSMGAAGRLILRDRSGSESGRQFRAQILESAGGGDKTLFVFELPRDVAGTALLTHSQPDRNHDQWVYLPSTKRVKRISAAGRTGSFAGTELTYEDLISPLPEKSRHRWLREEPCPEAAGLTCHVSQKIAIDPGSGYAREVLWVDTEALRVWQVHYFDRRDEHVKTLAMSGYRLYENRFWRADRMVMTNHQNGKSTVVLWDKYDFALRLGEDDFSRRALERAE